jgi:quinol monooxygenase YgiN
MMNPGSLCGGWRTERQMTFRPEYADGSMALVHEFKVATKAEPGNISFDWYRSADDPKVCLLVEAFADHDAGRAHVESSHFQGSISERCIIRQAASWIRHDAFELGLRSFPNRSGTATLFS